jgi:hypothetical protein
VTAEKLSRSQIESLIVARAVVFGDPQLFLVSLDRSRVSPAVFAILARMADRNLPDDQCAPQTKGQRELADRVCAVTVWDLMRTSVHELIAQSSPSRPAPTSRRRSSASPTSGTRSA